MAKTCIECGAGNPDDAVLCPACGSPASDATVLTPMENRPAYVGNDDLTGIGGWLILVAISLAVSPILIIGRIFVDFRLLNPVFAIKPGLAVLIFVEAVTNSIMLLAMVGLNVLFYRRMRQFPRWMITYLIAGFVLGLCDHIVAMGFNPSASWLAVFRSLIATLVWVPYFLQSQRVEQTFVN